MSSYARDRNVDGFRNPCECLGNPRDTEAVFCECELPESDEPGSDGVVPFFVMDKPLLTHSWHRPNPA